MHEFSLMQSALEMAVDRASQHGAERIERLTMRIGDLSGVVPEALQFAFEVLRDGTCAATAALAIERVPVRCHCSECDASFEPDGLVYVCPRCGAASGDIRSGREMELAWIEVT
ncbi:MAG TPA: hydrogenase maturation nickel metallochaperone HypA [Chthonomonadales bacterium]|nr:hydrogenase maturation nickel metallochaperone HypA [Chthonomonadales bacterium]